MSTVVVLNAEPTLHCVPENVDAGHVGVKTWKGRPTNKVTRAPQFDESAFCGKLPSVMDCRLSKDEIAEHEADDVDTNTFEKVLSKAGLESGVSALGVFELPGETGWKVPNVRHVVCDVDDTVTFC